MHQALGSQSEDKSPSKIYTWKYKGSWLQLTFQFQNCFPTEGAGGDAEIQGKAK